MNGMGKARLDVLIAVAQNCLEWRDHIAHDVFWRIMQERQQTRAWIKPWFEMHAEGFDNNAMLRHGKGMSAFGLPIPPRNPREAMSNIFNLDIHRGWVNQVQTPTRQHTLPDPGGWFAGGSFIRHHVSVYAIESRGKETPRFWSHFALK